MDQDEQNLRRAIAVISQSDPLIKLLQQVASGRMRSTDAGLRAVTESWLATYQKALGSEPFSRPALRRIDPTPRIAELIEAGVLSHDHPAIVSLLGLFEKLVAQAPQ
jgi:hypothetical protein